jgi:membrane protein
MGAFTKRVRELVDVWIDCFSRHDLLTHASAIAFQVLKSLVPLSLLGVALLGAVGRRDIWSRHLARGIHSRLDPSAFHAVNVAVHKIFAHDSALLIAFSAVLTIWYVSGGVRGIMGGINRIYEVDDNRPFWKRWPLSFGLSFCVVGCVVGAALLVEAVPKPGGALDVVVVPARWIGAIGALMIAAGVLVRLAPLEPRPKKWASAGGILVVAAWIVMSLVFRWYVSSVADFKTAAGQLAVFLVLMIWVYASSIVFLVGVQLDELLREDATGEERGILHILFGIGR